MIQAIARGCPSGLYLMKRCRKMPKMHEYIVEAVPPSFQGRSWRAPSSSPLRPNADAKDFPALVAEGVTGPIYVEAVSSYSGRNGPDGRPMLYKVRIAVLGGSTP